MPPRASRAVKPVAKVVKAAPVAKPVPVPGYPADLAQPSSAPVGVSASGALLRASNALECATAASPHEIEKYLKIADRWMRLAEIRRGLDQ